MFVINSCNVVLVWSFVLLVSIFLFLFGIFIFLSLHVNLILILCRRVHVQSLYTLVFMLTLEISYPVYKDFCSTVLCGTCTYQLGQTEEFLHRQIQTQPEGTHTNNIKSQLQSHIGTVRAGVNLGQCGFYLRQDF